MSVLGPGGHGVVVATPDPKRAATDRLTLRAAGIDAATLSELGLETSRELETPEERARFWAVVTRCPAVSREGDRLATGLPDGHVEVAEPAMLSSHLLTSGEAPPRRVAVFGGAWVAEDDPGYAEAAGFARRMAGEGVQVVCGGYGGVMEAVCRGASEAGGIAVGIGVSAWADRVTPNRWASHPADATDLFARLPLICDADAWVAFPGGVGTLAEIALCWNLMQLSVEPRPLVLVGDRWGRTAEQLRSDLVVVRRSDLELVVHAAAAGEAADLVSRLVGRMTE